MAAGTPLLLLLLLLLPAAIVREYYATFTASNGPAPKDDAGVDELHPMVVLAGIGCSDQEARLTEAYRPSLPRCGAMIGKGWFSLWHNVSDLQAHDYVPCFEEQMRLVYDPAINDYRNLPGVETRVPKFGSARAFHSKNPLTPKDCLDNLVESLEELGYRDNDTLFGAPFDWRYTPPVPGQTSQVYSHYFQRLKVLIEAASSKHNKKVIVFGHSYGGMVALEFVRAMPLAWRDRYIKHLILAAPTLSAGFMQGVLRLVSTSNTLFVFKPTTKTSLRTLWRSLELALADLPSPHVFGHQPIVVTKKRNYSAYDMEDYLAEIGFRDGIQPFIRRMIPKMQYFEAPMVPLTCINGVGIKTVRQLVFSGSDYDDVSPEMVYGDGDGYINLVSMSAFDKEMRRQPRQKRQFKSVKVNNIKHIALVTEHWAVKKVVQEILEANRISSF